MGNDHLLLRYVWQADQFRARHADFIAKYGDRYLEWFRGLPLYEWIPLPWSGSAMGPSVGLLCLLYIDGKIRLCFNREVTHVQRYADTEEEHDEWVKRNFKIFTKNEND